MYVYLFLIASGCASFEGMRGKFRESCGGGPFAVASQARLSPVVLGDGTATELSGTLYSAEAVLRPFAPFKNCSESDAVEFTLPSPGRIRLVSRSAVAAYVTVNGIVSESNRAHSINLPEGRHRAALHLCEAMNTRHGTGFERTRYLGVVVEDPSSSARSVGMAAAYLLALRHMIPEWNDLSRKRAAIGDDFPSLKWTGRLLESLL